MLCIQRQAYRMGSRSARVVAQRARAAESFFLDVKVCRWEVGALSPFQVATWVRSRCVGGAKSALARASSTLRVIKWATDWRFHLDHPLIQGHIKPSPDASDEKERPATALTPSLKMEMDLEGLVHHAETP